VNSDIFWVVVVIVGFVLAFFYTEVGRADPVSAEAEKLLAELSVPNSKTRNEWGMSTFRVFGRVKVMGVFRITLAGPTETSEIADSPETKEVIIPLWVEGQGLNGEPLKRSRKLCVTVVKGEGESGWKVQGHEFRNDQPLAFWQQLVRWLIGASFAPAILFFALFSDAIYSTFQWVMAIMLFIFGVFTLLFVGYLTYCCFGSTGAGIVGVIVYIVAIYLMLRLRASLLRRAQEFSESR